jgi:hypothetical protein
MMPPPPRHEHRDEREQARHDAATASGRHAAMAAESPAHAHANLFRSAALRAHAAAARALAARAAFGDHLFAVEAERRIGTPVAEALAIVGARTLGAGAASVGESSPGTPRTLARAVARLHHVGTRPGGQGEQRDQYPGAPSHEPERTRFQIEWRTSDDGAARRQRACTRVLWRHWATMCVVPPGTGSRPS